MLPNTPTPEPNLEVLILNWNGCDDTLACLESLASQNDCHFRSVVLDNGSQDDSVAAIGRAFPAVEIVEIGENLGYAGGNNVGLARALARDTEWILVLNNDTILDPNCLAQLLKAARKQPAAAAFSPKVLIHDSDELLYAVGGDLDARSVPYMIGFREPDGPGFDEPTQPLWLNGCAILFRSDALRDVGLFEERFFLNFEDTDWSLRARQRGWELHTVPSARIWHRVSSSFGSSRTPVYLYYYTRNHLLWIQRHHRTLGLFRSLRGFTVRAWKAWKRSFKISRRHAWAAAREILRGMAHYALGRFGPRLKEDKP